MAAAHTLPLRQMRDELASREISPRELVEAHLVQIERVNGRINAFVEIYADDCRQAAKEMERYDGRPLWGVPVTIKDSFDIQGRPTYCGSKLRLDHCAEADAAVVERLRQAGAIILGKTNCPEFLLNYETDNFITGYTANPWNPEFAAGGSSGGEAAAIAACCSAGGIGSDAGGSIRVPAHFCGLAGLKPTPGRISGAGHFPPIGHPFGLLGVVGPMARTADDLKLLFAVLAGYDWRDPLAAAVPQREPVMPRRMGIFTQPGRHGLQEECRTAVEAAARAAEGLGVACEPFVFPSYEQARELWWFFFGRLLGVLMRPVLAANPEQTHWTSKELIGRLDPNDVPSAEEILETFAARDALRGQLLAAMEHTPVVIAPVSCAASFRQRQRMWETPSGSLELLDAMAPSFVWNLVGCPSVVIPFGFSQEGTPVGIQIVGRPWCEEDILEVACRLEEARGAFPLCGLAATN